MQETYENVTRPSHGSPVQPPPQPGDPRRGGDALLAVGALQGVQERAEGRRALGPGDGGHHGAQHLLVEVSLVRLARHVV